ncbi:hypothetical protein CAEBREN_06875 [Caenorhabditis brenneri]|uniref:Uncharacterized protein n=1 Tax=Caenorhabditis brenneri TaxID=135651 RepID=G0MW73_CAEBE|nr:hypothetical protein CAEBREN_06875 [Caenorhabditis brenneri]
MSNDQFLKYAVISLMNNAFPPGGTMDMCRSRCDLSTHKHCAAWCSRALGTIQEGIYMEKNVYRKRALSIETGEIVTSQLKCNMKNETENGTGENGSGESRNRKRREEMSE